MTPDATLFHPQITIADEIHFRICAYMRTSTISILSYQLSIRQLSGPTLTMACCSSPYVQLGASSWVLHELVLTASACLNG